MTNERIYTVFADPRQIQLMIGDDCFTVYCNKCKGSLPDPENTRYDQTWENGTNLLLVLNRINQHWNREHDG